MRNRRWSGKDRHFWPFTWCTGDSWRLGFMLDSGADNGEPGDCHIRFHFGRLTVICELPKIVSDFRERHWPKWDAETVARIGRDWYDECFPREYGAMWVQGDLHVHYGAQTHSSNTTKSRVFFMPWRNYRSIRTSYFDERGEHFVTERDSDRNSWRAQSAVKDACPKVRFALEDFDGQKIIATTHIVEREWRIGTGSFKWLSWLRRPRISRELQIEFSAEVGPEKGSWKGGTVGSGIEMLPGELHEAAFMRYCQKEHRAKSRRFQVRYLGPALVAA